MRKSFRFARLAAAAVIAAVGLSILGIGAALAAPGKSPAKPVKVMVSHEQSSKDRVAGKASSRDKTSRDRAVHAERGDGMR
jgi:multidrug efflux pump subunit AcrA (membrane-fusion protein)